MRFYIYVLILLGLKVAAAFYAFSLSCCIISLCNLGTGIYGQSIERGNEQQQRLSFGQLTRTRLDPDTSIKAHL